MLTLTGGYYTNTAVTMYNLTGNFWELPEMNTGRWSHGCGFYTRGEQTVSIYTREPRPERPPIIIRFTMSRTTALQ